MTRNEFIDNINDFADLQEFCWDKRYDICDDIMSYESMSETIWDDIHSWEGGWEGLADYLSELPRDSYTGYYRYNGRLDFDPLDDDDFEQYKQEVLEIADGNGDFDEDEEDEDEEDVETAADPDAWYYFQDPMTGEIFVSGDRLERVELDGFIADA